MRFQKPIWPRCRVHHLQLRATQDVFLLRESAQLLKMQDNLGCHSQIRESLQNLLNSPTHQWDSFPSLALTTALRWVNAEESLEEGGCVKWVGEAVRGCAGGG